MSENMETPSGQLNSWKEIADHLRRSVRTVHRWEQEEGLPVHRQKHEKGASVYAYRSELDAWLKLKLDMPKASQQTSTMQEPSGSKSVLLANEPATQNYANQPVALVRPSNTSRPWIAFSLALALLSFLWFLRHSHIEIRLNGAQPGGSASFQSPK